MLVKNKKVILDQNTICVSAPINTMATKIVAEVFDMVFERFYGRNIKINTDDVLYISDSSIRSKTLISVDDFENYKRMFGGNENGDEFVRIPTVNAFKLYDDKGINKYLENNDLPSLIIMGHINNIPSEIIRNILHRFNRAKVVMFGDELLTSPEDNNGCATFLTNTEFSCVHNYSDNKISPHKKINSLLTKLRNEKLQVVSTLTPSTGRIFRELTSDLDYYNISEKLSGGYNVVVPRRILSHINSNLKILMGKPDMLSLPMGTTCYSRYPFCFTVDDQQVIIPPMSKIVIGLQQGSYETRDSDGRRIALRNISVTNQSMGIKLDLANVPIDLTSYILQFNPDMEIDNYEDYDDDMIKYIDPVSFSPDILSVIPFRVFTAVEQKYVSSESLLALIETIETDTEYSLSNSSWYQEMSNVTSLLDIIVSATYFDEQ